jgi:hypothetical protein
VGGGRDPAAAAAAAAAAAGKNMEGCVGVGAARNEGVAADVVHVSPALLLMTDADDVDCLPERNWRNYEKI